MEKAKEWRVIEGNPTMLQEMLNKLEDLYDIKLITAACRGALDKSWLILILTVAIKGG